MKNKISYVTLTVCSILVVFFFNSCAPVELQLQESGFVDGLGHGFCAFFATIGKKMGMNISVFASNNSGFTYWFGFDIGVLLCMMLMSALLFFLVPLPALLVVATVIYGVFYLK